MIFVSTAKLNENEMRSLGAYVDSIIVKENSGYDFGSWKAGLRSEEDLRKYDEIVICNDSVYGPLWPIGVAFKKMETRDCDFWGITASRRSKGISRAILSFLGEAQFAPKPSLAFGIPWNRSRPKRMSLINTKLA